MSVELADTAPISLAAGAEVSGHRIERLLGDGGFGAVYAATDLALHRQVAFKVLRRIDARHLARFRDEARLLARINDPHVIQIYRIGQLPGGEPFIAMERFGDGSLAEALPEGRPTSADFAVRVTAQVLRALVAAHAGGIVHRDIKEANVLLDQASGIVKLCDFGIARSQLGDGEADTGNLVIGTPHYLAPERYAGVRDDPRSDLYSVGVVLYRMLVGHRPHEAPGANATAVARRAIVGRVELPSGVPRALARVCAQLLAPDPALRYETAHAALEALLRAFRAQPTASVAGPDALALAPVGVPLLEGPAPRRSGRLVGLAVLLLVFCGVGWWAARPPLVEHAPDAASLVAPPSSAPASAAPPSKAQPVSSAQPPSDAAPVSVAQPVTEAPKPKPAKRRPSRASATRVKVAPASVPPWKMSRKALSDRARDNPIKTGDGGGRGITERPRSVGSRAPP